MIAKEDPAYISTFFFHELSHVTDNRELGEWNTSVTKLATEYKAVAVQMMVYDELLRTGKIKSDHSIGIEFLLSVYRWKNGGPKPNMDFSTVINGKRYSAAEIIALSVGQGDTGLQSVWNLTKLFYNLSEGTIQEKDLRYLQSIRGFMKDMEPKYQAWFPSKPPVVPPTPQPQPSPHPQPGPQPGPQPQPHPQPGPRPQPNPPQPDPQPGPHPQPDPPEPHPHPDPHPYDPGPYNPHF